MGSTRTRSAPRRTNGLPDAAGAAASKFTRPLSAGSFPRKRLFRLLDENRKRPAIWVSGPPGSGKTTLVSGYVAERRLPCLWYDIDECDTDPATFFHYLGIAARRASPRSRAPLPLLTPDRLPALPLFAREYFETLFLRLKAPSLVVFDNYHHIPAESPLHGMIRNAAGTLPKGINLVLVGRNNPPPAFARLRAARLLSNIGWESIRLSPTEAAGIARLRSKTGRISKNARELCGRAEGWAAGLVLLLESHPAGNIRPRRSDRRTPEEIFDYFAGEVFGSLDEEKRVFLLRTAFLPQMTVRLAERLTGENRAGRILAALSRGNLFTLKHAGAEVVYRYHALFREYLRGVAEDALPPGEVSRLRKSAAALSEEAGLVEDAAFLMREAGDREGLSRVIRKQAASLIAQGRSRVLFEWLGALPPEKIRSDPWLLYWSGTCRLPFNPGESRGHFEAAFRLFDAQGDAAGVFLAWSGVVDAIVYGPDGLKPLDPWLSDLERLTAKHGRFPSGEIEARVTCAMVKGLALRRPPSVNMKEWADRAFAVARSVRTVPAQIELLTNLSYYHFHGGDFLKTVLVLDALRELVRSDGVSPLARLTVGWVKAAHANMTARYGRCRRIVSENLERARSSGVRLMDYMLSGHGALAALHAGNLPAARTLLRKMSATLNAAKPWEACFFHFVAGCEALGRGDLPRATLQAEQSLALSGEAGNPWTAALAHLQTAFVLHASGDRAGAGRQLAEGRGLGDRADMRFIQFVCRLAEAYFAFEAGREKNGLASLAEGLAIGRGKGYATVYLWHPTFVRKIAAKALEAGIEVPYVEDFIRRNALLPDPAQADGESWPWPLRVYTLGRFEILKDGEPFSPSRKVPQKPLLMLKVLIALGGRDVPQERLTDILWPEAEGDLGHQSFSSTLLRLRKLLGDGNHIRQREGRLTLDNRSCWVDLWSFVRIRKRIDEAVAEEGAGLRLKECIRLLERAVALYKGPFLAEETAPWAAALREHTRGKFLRCVSELGRLRELAGEWEKAAACYQRGLEVDEVAEGFYVRLMHCYKALGRTAEAIAVYERCRKMLSSVPGARPSPWAESLYRSLQTF